MEKKGLKRNAGRRKKKKSELRKYDWAESEGNSCRIKGRLLSRVEMTERWKLHLSENLLCKLGPCALCFHPTCEVNYSPCPTKHLAAGHNYTDSAVSF